MKITEFLTTSRDTVHAYHRMCEPVLHKYDIPQVSFDILMFLTNNPAFHTAQEISELRNIKKNLVSVHIEKLVQAGLLQRNAVPGDRRKIALSCTEKARPIVEEGLAMQRSFFEKLTAGAEESDMAGFQRVNAVISRNAAAMLHG